MPALLEFEKPIVELETKINELKAFAAEKDIDLSNEIDTLEKRARELKQNIYGNLTPWQKVQIARHPERPNALDYIKLLITDFITLSGDRLYGDDPAVVGGIGRFDGQPVTVIAHLKGKDTKQNVACNFGMAHPEGYRKAIRLMKQAEKFKRPVICLVDTPGAYCGMGAEERGQGEAIARSLMEMSTLKIPLISVIIGEGGSGGALAFSVSDRILMQEHAIFSVSTPEACASILWKDGTKAQQAAAALRLTAQDLLDLEVTDEIIAEPLGGAHRNAEEAAKLMAKSIRKHLGQLKEIASETLVDHRYKKFRAMGKMG
ncbi:acetyl-CoA carboxylase carboxyltransferase subunit alpha [Desulfofalx alkaliphila]|uniref:acetyl-CoA carboxylase carboxyltransferase subunit alpha n=1 Tax=Desulfofalx alkaliphila TaxID=105483 RepID=UPI0004E235A3|nr:acetyl-CoA carboxylase carboxyltransferase subunit alpha [Desulfofalx alkaliphila]